MKILLLCLLVSSALFNNDEAIASSVDTNSISTEEFAHWLDAAYIASGVYQDKEEVEKVFGVQGYQLSHFNQLEGYSVTYALATNDETKEHILAVRGTDNIENIIVDSAFVLVPDKITGIDIHQGFLLAAKDIYQRVQPDIKPGYKINAIGHSLGGAAALILAMMLDSQNYPIDEVITFGQPKVTNIEGSNKFTHLNIKRLVTPKDIVPLVPPVDPMDMMKLSIFWHQGTEIILFANDQYAVTTGIESMMRALDFLNDVPSQQHVSNHFMSTYIDNLKSKLKGPKRITYKNDFKFSDWFGPPSTKN